MPSCRCGAYEHCEGRTGRPREPASIGWAMLLGGSASAVASIALDRLHALTVIGLLVVTHLIGYEAVGASPAMIVGHPNSLVTSAAMT
ncbi:hypothetical protein [Streptomyces sp. NPDC008001]|uniref:hypothetical protein n=1 Tax=Streptomyces sp. NPDC008001 TaxID=3364804 RepID=UPI0036EFB65C